MVKEVVNLYSDNNNYKLLPGNNVNNDNSINQIFVDKIQYSPFDNGYP